MTDPPRCRPPGPVLAAAVGTVVVSTAATPFLLGVAGLVHVDLRIRRERR